MTEALHFALVSPERLIASGDVQMVTLPGTEGEFGVMAGHAPIVVLLRPGVAVIERSANSAPERIFLSGGYAEVSNQGLTVLADDAIPVGELKRGEIEKRIKDATEDLSDATGDEARLKANTALQQLKDLLSAAP